VVAALARADRLCEPGTTARIAALEAVMHDLLHAVDVDAAGYLGAATEAVLDRLRALDAAPAGAADA
jgi:hypothetical protein